MFADSGAFAPFYDTLASVRGVRQGGRHFALAVNACVLEDGSAAGSPPDGIAPDLARFWTVTFPVREWREPTPPEAMDTVSFIERGNRTVTARVAAVRTVGADVYSLDVREKRGAE